MAHRWLGRSKAKSPLAPLWPRGVGGISLLTLIFIIACGAAATATPVPTATKAPAAAAPAATSTPAPIATKAPVAAAPTATPVPAAQPTPTPIAAPKPTPTPGVVIKTGGIIPMQDYAAPVTARPLPEATYSHLKNLSPMYNQIVEYNPETADYNDIRCDLCRSWEMSKDGMTFVYRLHEKARWWDGKPVTAEDVVFSLDSFVDPRKPEFGDLYKGHEIRTISGMIKPYYKSSRAIDEKTVEVTLLFPAPAWHPTLGLDGLKIMPKHVVLGERKLQGLGTPQNMVGSGPFKLQKFTKDVSIELVKNADYWKEGYPRIDGMKHFIIVDHGTVVAAFKTGQVLITNGLVNNLSNAEALQLKKDLAGKATVHIIGPAAMLSLMMNVTKKPYDDPKVRRAIYLALHRQPFIDALTAGVDVLGVPFPPGSWYGRTLEEAAQLPGFRELDGKKHPADIEAARKLLAEAGYPQGFKMTLMARQALEFVDVAQIAADQLKRFLNIDVTIRTMESAVGQAAYLSGDYDIAVQGSSIDLIDPDGAFGNRYVEGGLISIWMRFVHPRVQELFLEQARELDQGKRKALIRKAEDILLFEDNAYPGIYWSMRSYVVDNRIKNFNPLPIIHADLKFEHIWCDPKC